MELVSIIIPNWNGKEHLKKCLCSLENLDYPNYEIILVDGNSSDGSVEFIKENYPQVEIVQNDRNLGFAETNNIGYKKAKGEYILFLNNDTEVEPDFLLILIKKLNEDKDIVGVQPKFLQMDNHEALDCIGDFLTFSGFLYHFGYRKKADNPKYLKTMELFAMKGVAMLFKRSVLEEVGVFDSDFFAYFEETDLCWRMQLAGYKIAYIPESIVYHKGKGTSSKINFSFIDYHSFKNRICSLIKNLEFKSLLKILPIHLCLCVLCGITLVLKGEISHGIAIFKAIGWNIANFEQTLKKRRFVQKNIRKITDKELFTGAYKNPRFSYYYYLFTNLENYKD